MLQLAHEGLLALRLRAVQVVKAALGHMQDAQVLHTVLLGRMCLNYKYEVLHLAHEGLLAVRLRAAQLVQAALGHMQAA